MYKNAQHTADAESFTAAITPGAEVWRATLTYKPGFRQRGAAVSARDEDALMAALRQIDSTVRFYRTANSEKVSARVAQDESMLEGLRVNPDVSYLFYQNACRSMKQPIKPRPVFNEPKVAPVAIIGLEEQGSAMLQFMARHPELAESGHENFNYDLIKKWHAAEQLQVTAQSLAWAYAEIHSHYMFRTRTAGMRGGEIVRPFDMGLIRSDRAKPVQSAVPTQLRNVSVAAARKSQAEVLAEARRRAKQQRPDLFTATVAVKGESAELRQVIDKILLQMAREENPNIGMNPKSDRYAGYRG